MKKIILKTITLCIISALMIFTLYINVSAKVNSNAESHMAESCVSDTEERTQSLQTASDADGNRICWWWWLTAAAIALVGERIYLQNKIEEEEKR